MAIKGKGRTKRRGGAAPPKPVYVEPKRPLLSRRGFWIGVGITVVVVAIVSVTWALIVQHHDNQVAATKKAEADIVRNFGQQIDTALAHIGTGTQESFTAFPNLGSYITEVQKGNLSEKIATKKADEFVAQAQEAEAALQKINGQTLVGSHTNDLQDLVIGQNLIVQGLKLYEQVAVSLKLSAQASGQLQKDLIKHTTDLMTDAANVFSSGYNDIVGLRLRFGVINLNPQTGGPTGTTGIPGAP